MTLTHPPAIGVHRFTVADYHRMIETGVLREEDAVELLEGWIVDQMPRNPPHDATVDQAGESLGTALPREWRVRVQLAVTLGDSEPEPDLAVVLGPARRYSGAHPGPADIAVLVEVAGTSLDHDRNIKGPIYAAAGVPVYWVINLGDAQVEVYTNPTPTGYATRDDFRPPAAVPLVVAGQLIASIPVRDLLA